MKKGEDKAPLSTFTSTFMQGESLDMPIPKVNFYRDNNDRKAVLSTTINFNEFWKKIEKRSRSDQDLPNHPSQLEAKNDIYPNYKSPIKKEPKLITVSSERSKKQSKKLPFSNITRATDRSHHSRRSEGASLSCAMQQVNVQKVMSSITTQSITVRSDIKNRVNITESSNQKIKPFDCVRNLAELRHKKKTMSMGKLPSIRVGLGAKDPVMNRVVEEIEIGNTEPNGNKRLHMMNNVFEKNKSDITKRNQKVIPNSQINTQNQELKNYVKVMKVHYANFMKKLEENKLTRRIPQGVEVYPTDFNEFYKLHYSSRINNRLFAKEPSESYDDKYNLVSIDSYGVAQSLDNIEDSFKEESEDFPSVNKPSWLETKAKNRKSRLKLAKRIKKNTIQRQTKELLRINNQLIAQQFKTKKSMKEISETESLISCPFDSFCSNPLEGYTLEGNYHDAYEKLFPKTRKDWTNVVSNKKLSNQEDEYENRFSKLRVSEGRNRRRTTHLIGVDFRMGRFNKPHKQEFKMVPRMLIINSHRPFSRLSIKPQPTYSLSLSQ